MKLQVDQNKVTITLSKRNLLALLSKVDEQYSAKTIYKRYQGEDHSWLLVLKVEQDDQHYKEVAPGQMVDWTEEFIKENNGSDLQ